MPGATGRGIAERQRLGRIESKRRVRRQHDAASAGTMILDRVAQIGDGILVEAGQRFVEQPEVRQARHQPAQRDAAALPGRQHPARQFGQRPEPEPVERRVDRRAAAHPGPECQRLGHGQRRLQRIGMTDEMKPRAVPRRVLGNRLAVPRELSFRGRRQPRHEAQEARLAASVGAGKDKRAGWRHGKVESRKHHPLAAPASQAAAGETGLRERGLDHAGKYRRRAAPIMPRRRAQEKRPRWGGQPRPFLGAVRGGTDRCGDGKVGDARLSPARELTPQMRHQFEANRGENVDISRASESGAPVSERTSARIAG